MKNATLSVCFAFVLVGGLSAQIRIGLKAGANLSYFRDMSASSEIVRTAFLAGPQAGFCMQIPFSKHWQLNSELLYIHKTLGIVSSPKSELNRETIKFPQGYIAWPVLLEWNWSENFSCAAGMELSYAVVDYGKGFIYHNEKFDVAVLGQIRYRFNTHLDATFRYTHDLNPASLVIYTDYNGVEVERSRWLLASWQLSLGWWW